MVATADRHDVSHWLSAHHALFALLPEAARRDLLNFVARFLRGRDIALSDPDSHIDLLVAANAGLVGMYQPVDAFASVDWIYIGEGDGEHDGEAWGRNKVVLEARAVVEESSQILQGANVVIHEFAHVLDQLLGYSGRTPGLRGALEAHLATLNAGGASCIADWRESIPIDRVMDSDFSYLEQVEFFAYASEAFFTAGDLMREELPELYRELWGIYRIDMGKLLEDHIQ